ncbi:uncharacterized protein LOC9636230 [Selaginella moellendorffii]|nr:uncharacterized protein LOC9636230 [Selaginella moellendorffii]|eukprot:XP_024543235.1 uncharacterized protein LOC9636230 [Selaginella moellendorffii]
MLRGSKSDDGAIYTGNYKNIFTRIQHNLQELSSRSSKSKGPPRVETLLRRLDVVNPAISCEEKGHKLLQPGSPLLLEDEEDSHFEALKNWNIKEMTELAWSSGLSDDNSADWEGHVESRSQLKDDDGDSDYEALKTWNVKEMTRSAWSAGRFPNVNLSSQSIETDKLDSPGQLFEVPQQDLLSSLYSEPEEEKLSFEVTKDTLGLHSIDGNDSQLEGDGHSDCEELRSAGQFDISEIQEELRSAGRFDISEIQDEEEDGYNQGYDSPGKLFEVDSLCFKLEDDCPGKLFEVSQHDSVSFKPEEENFDFEFPKNPLDGIYKSGARLALQSLVGFTTGNSDTLDW